MKKNKSCIALLLLFLTTLNTYSMEPAPENASSLKWVALAGGVLLGAVGLRQFLSYIHSEPATPFPFGDLPIDAQSTIVSFLGQYTSAKTVYEAAQTINALARTNKQLEQFINDPRNCL